jgi:hypothetical protein
MNRAVANLILVAGLLAATAANAQPTKGKAKPAQVPASASGAVASPLAGPEGEESSAGSWGSKIETAEEKERRQKEEEARSRPRPKAR